MRQATGFASVVMLLNLTFAADAAAQEAPESDWRRISVRAGVGTDIGLGLAYGAAVNYQLGSRASPIELGIIVFGGSFKETSTEGIHTYNEQSDVFVIGAMANYIASYHPETPSFFFLAGIGLVSVSVDYTESSPTDTSLGAPLPGGGSILEESATGGGSVFNLGVGYVFGPRFDVRLELPFIVPFAPPGESAGVIPALTLTGGLRF